MKHDGYGITLVLDAVGRPAYPGSKTTRDDVDVQVAKAHFIKTVGSLNGRVADMRFQRGNPVVRRLVAKPGSWPTIRAWGVGLRGMSSPLCIRAVSQLPPEA